MLEDAAVAVARGATTEVAEPPFAVRNFALYDIYFI